jgi:hypothetical protein
MASEFIEYEFTLPDGSAAFEMVERCDAIRQVAMFRAMHKAVAARPIELTAESAEAQARRLDAAVQGLRERRLRRRPPQEFDTSALPLFGDQSRQIDLFAREG